MDRLIISEQEVGYEAKDKLARASGAIGKFIEYWGFKSIEGRIWSLVFLSESPISTPQIVDILEVSKATASIGINELLRRGLIQISGKVENGALTYISTPDVGAVVRDVLRERELRLISDAETNLNLLFSLSVEELESINISQANLEQLLELTQVSKKLVTRLTSRRFNVILSWATFFKKVLRAF